MKGVAGKGQKIREQKRLEASKKSWKYLKEVRGGAGRVKCISCLLREERDEIFGISCRRERTQSNICNRMIRT